MLHPRRSTANRFANGAVLARGLKWKALGKFETWERHDGDKPFDGLEVGDTLPKDIWTISPLGSHPLQPNQQFSRVWFGHRATRTARRAARNTGSGRILLPLSAVDAIAPARSWSHLPGGMDIVNCVTYLNRTISAVSAPPPPCETS